jgi:hypothetical protein
MDLPRIGWFLGSRIFKTMKVTDAGNEMQEMKCRAFLVRR